MEQSIKADLHRYSQSTERLKNIKAIFFHPGARFIYLYRNCQKYGKIHPLGLFFRLWIKILLGRKNVEIPLNTKIGKGLYLGHFKNIIINANSKIGNNCNIMQGVTIGNESRGKRKGSPIIGNRVLIGPNSVVSGKIVIGNDVLIAPLTFVNFDVPDSAVVLGNPAKIVSYSGSKGYINRTLE
jgi:serine O-acetyltransferase